jgi:hypothetical protein
MLVWLIVVGMLAGAAASIAATTAPHGALTPLTGPGSCLGGGPASGCAPLRGVTATTANRQDSGSSISTLTATQGDGTLYVTGGIDVPAGIAVLRRDPRTGALTQPTGVPGCITAGHRVTGCAFVPSPGHLNDFQIAPDGTQVAIEYLPPGRSVQAEQLFARDPRTGAVHRLGGPRACVALLSGVCGEVHGLRPPHQTPLGPNPTSVYPLAAGTRLVTRGAAGPSGGQGIAVQRRAQGRWREVPGSAGCTNWRGTAGCHRLACLRHSVSDAVAGGGGRVYVVGGADDTGYIATFRRTGSGGLQPLGCAALAPHSPTGKPIWVGPLPHSSSVLLAAHYFDHEAPLNRERIYVATPGPHGALTRPRAISGALAFDQGDAPALSPDGRTLYGADYLIGNGGLYVYGVTPTAITPFPAPWFNPYATPTATNGLHDNGVNATPLVSPDGRFVYTVTGPFQHPSSTNQPEVHVYRTQP